jgi:peptidoglycan/LPS O-acetylase OafA/YrhL
MIGKKPIRLPQLDALRTLAIVLVLGRHFDYAPPASEKIAGAIMSLWYRVGWTGVDLFFVLSGYLISGLLFREYIQHGNVNLKRFLVRRGLKIYPAFFALFAATCVIRYHAHAFSIKEALAEALFVQNYFQGQWLHTWSLAVEEHFYLGAALGIAILTRRGGSNPFRNVPIAFAVIGAGCLSMRIINSLRHPDFDFFTQMCQTHLRADSLMFGVLLCYYDQFHRERFRAMLGKYRIPIALLSLTLISTTGYIDLETFYMHTIGPTALYVGFGGLLMLLLNSSTAGRSRALGWIGRIGFYSYSIYLWHIDVRHTALAHVPMTHYWRLLAAYTVGSIALGIFMARVVEIPVLFLRDRFFPAEAVAVKPAEAMQHDENTPVELST